MTWPYGARPASRTSTVLLDASPEISWQFVIDHGDELEPLRFEPQGEQGVGMLNHVGLRRFGRRPIAVSRTMEWSPPRRCVFESEAPTHPVRARITEEFHDDPAGTRHTITYEVVPTFAMARPLATLMAVIMIRNRRRFQRRLQRGLRRPWRAP